MTTATAPERVAFVAKLRAAAVAAGLSDAAARLVVAQAAFESDYGRGFAAQMCRNPFNLTALASEPGVVQVAADLDANGEVITQRWRSFEDEKAAVRGLLELFRRSHYANTVVFDALAGGDPARYAHELRLGRYYEATEAKYSAGLTAVWSALDSNGWVVAQSMGAAGAVALIAALAVLFGGGR